MRLGPRHLGVMAAVGLVVGNVGRLPGLAIGSAKSALTLFDLVLIPLWGYLLVQWRRGVVRWELDAVSRALFVFVGVSVSSLVLAIPRWELSATQTLTAAAFLIRWIAYAGWFVLIVTATDDEERSLPAWRALEVAILVIALFGIAQSAFWPGFAQRIHEAEVMRWDRQGRRLVSTILDPNYAGSLLILVLGMRIARELLGLRTSRWSLVPLTVALALTLSRSAVLGLAAGIGAMVLIVGVTKRGVLRALGVALILAPAIPPLLAFADTFNKLTVDVSGLQRLVAWMQALTMMRDHPLLGVGFNAIDVARRAYGFSIIGSSGAMDGGLLVIGAMTGVIGLAVFLWMWGRLFGIARSIWRDEARAPEVRAVAIGTVGVSVAILVQSFFVNAILLPFVMVPLWVLWGWVVSLGRKSRQLLLLFGVLGMTACDPCAGLLTCEVPPARVAAGTILDRETRRPKAGVQVSVGALRTVSNREGRWSIPLAFGPDSILDIEVRTSDSTSYTVPSVYIRPRTRVGEADDLGPWFDRPILQFVTRVLYRGEPLSGARIEFRPTEGSRDTLITATTTEAGYLDLFGTAERFGEVRGTMWITHPRTGRREYADAAVPSDYRLRIPTVLGALQVDRPMVYVGEVVNRMEGYRKVGGAQVTFIRRSGVRVVPETLTVTSEPDGRFTVRLEALSLGELRGDFSVVSPDGRHRSIKRDIPMVVRDTTTSRYLGLFPYGQLWAWAIEIWRNDQLLPSTGLRYRFERTSGLSISPAVFEGQTDGGGRIWIGAPVSDSGAVEGRVTVYPVGGPAQTLPPVFQLPTFQDDQPAFAGVFVHGPALRYLGRLLGPTGAPVAGASVTWERVGGIGAVPAVITSTSGPDGGFDLVQYPSADGEVRGRIIVRPPAPWAPGTVLAFEEIRLSTHDTPEPRIGVTLRLPTP